MPLQRKLVSTKTFEKSYKKFASNNQVLKNAINKALFKMEQDAFEPSLRTHKLSGKLTAYSACSCGYNCRIIFIIEKDLHDPGFENIILLDIGTHDDVY